MGSESATPPNDSYQKPPNPEPELAKATYGNIQDAKEEATKETSSKSVFFNSEPMREEQVQNAVNFLTHPKVRGSPVVYRRSFLEKKGLTKEEIDEAFRRAPDPPPSATPVDAATSNQNSQSKPSTNIQPQVPTQAQQPAAPSSIISTMANYPKSQFHWSHAFLAVGLLAASGAGTAVLFKNAFVPRLKSWIRKVVLEEDDSVKKIDSKPSLAEEAAAAAKAAAAAAADVAKASQEILNSKGEEKRYLEAFMGVLETQMEEMKSMNNAIRKLEGTREVALSSNKIIEENIQSTARNARPSSAPSHMEPSPPPHPKSFMEIMAMVQRGEKPPGIKDIDDLPPNPNQPPSNPRLAPRIKPWDNVPNLQNPSVGDSSYNVQANGSSQLNGNGSAPWWQQKNVRITEIEPEDEVGSTPYGLMNERSVQRSWVPPQPPPIAMPEAAAAIRLQKPLVQNEQRVDVQMNENPLNNIDELQRITKLSESGQVENNEGTGLNLKEIQEVENNV